MKKLSLPLLSATVLARRKAKKMTQAQLAQSQAVYNFIVAKANLEQTLGNDIDA